MFSLIVVAMLHFLVFFLLLASSFCYCRCFVFGVFIFVFFISICFHLGSVDTTYRREKFENVAIFLWKGLLSTLIRHENGALPKRS